MCMERVCGFASDKLFVVGMFISVLHKKSSVLMGLYLCSAQGLCLQHSSSQTVKNEPKSSMTGEGNLKPNPWLPAATIHISSGSNDSWYLLKFLCLCASLLTTEACSQSTVDYLKCTKVSSILHDVTLHLIFFLLSRLL